MSLKESLQFLAMMIPTLLILGAVALTVALPAKSAVHAVSTAEAVQGAPHVPEHLDTL